MKSQSSWSTICLVAVVLFLVGPSCQQGFLSQLFGQGQQPQNGNTTGSTNGTAQAPGTRMILNAQPVLSQQRHVQLHQQHHLLPQQRRQQEIQIDFIPQGLGGQMQTQMPRVHASAQMTPDQQKQMQAMTNPEQGLQNLVINPADIQFTVPDMPDSVGTQIIDQIRNQLGNQPIPLSELNQKFVSFSAQVPGVMINRTVVTNIEEQTIDQNNKTTRTILSRGGPPVSYSTGSTGSYSTPYQPIVSYPYNPALSTGYQQQRSADPYSQKTYSAQSYSYTVPQESSYSTQGYGQQAKTTESNYNQQQQQQSYQQAQTYTQQPQQSYQQPSKPKQSESYGQQQQNYQAKPQEQHSYQKPAQSSYSQPKDSYQPQQQQQTYQSQPACPPQPVKVVYVEVCSNPTPNYAAPVSYQAAPAVQIVQQQQYQPQAQTYQQQQQQQQQPQVYQQQQQTADSYTTSNSKDSNSGLGLTKTVLEAGKEAQAGTALYNDGKVAVDQATDIVKEKLDEMYKLQQQVQALQSQLRLENYAVPIASMPSAIYAPNYAPPSYASAPATYNAPSAQSYGQPGYGTTIVKNGPSYSTSTYTTTNEYSTVKTGPSQKTQQTYSSSSNSSPASQNTYTSAPAKAQTYQAPAQQYQSKPAPAATNYQQKTSSYQPQQPSTYEAPKNYVAPQSKPYTNSQQVEVTSEVKTEQITLGKNAPAGYK